jgi:hypothetical protein
MSRALCSGAGKVKQFDGALVADRLIMRRDIVLREAPVKGRSLVL